MPSLGLRLGSVLSCLLLRQACRFGLFGGVGRARPEHFIGNLFITVFAAFKDLFKQGLEGQGLVRLFVVNEAVPEGDDQSLLVLHGAFDGLTYSRAFIGDITAVKADKAADKACGGMIGFDVLTQEGDALLQVVQAVLWFQDHAIDSNHTIVREIID